MKTIPCLLLLIWMSANSQKNAIFTGQSTRARSPSNNAASLNDTLTVHFESDSIVNISTTSKLSLGRISYNKDGTLFYSSIRDNESQNSFHLHGQYARKETVSGCIVRDSIKLTYTIFLVLDLAMENCQQYSFEGKLSK